MKKLFLSMILMALPLVVSAYDVEVDGIYYNLIPKGNAAEVTYLGTNRWGDPFSDYSGAVSIPEKFVYKGVEYSVNNIGYGAFQFCSGLTSITIPNSVTSIGEKAFAYCEGLTSITIPNSVTSIENSAFYGCNSLTAVNITDLEIWCKISFVDNPLTYAQHLFINGKEITNLVIPNTITSIGDNVFRGFRGMTSVTIPNTVTTIGNSSFYGCNGLTSVTIPNSVTRIEQEAFSGCNGLTSVTIPNSVTSIGYGAFEWCSGLTSVTIPNSVTSIGWFAFSHCSSLTSVSLGNSVSSISDWAFSSCDRLEEVYCFAENVPSAATNIFEYSYPEYITLYVPASALEKYKNQAPWNVFKNIKAIPGDVNRCATPTISYADKRLTFACETEGVEYVSEIKDTDIGKFYDGKVSLSATYEISVYATKSGYENSDVATATLVWTDAIFTVTTPETPTSAKEVKESIPVLISANGGVITVKSEQEGQPVAVYMANGKALGSATVKDGQATVATNIQRGEIVIVKVGGRSVKVKMSDF